MFSWDDLKKYVYEARLGPEFDQAVVRACCKAIYGGVAWPGVGKDKGSGGIVILSIGKESHIDNPDMLLLEEFESYDIRELVWKCGALDLKYAPQRWIGDIRHTAARRFLLDYNSELEYEPSKRLRIGLSPMHDMDRDLYSIILPEIKEALHPDRRRLFLKGSMAVTYLSARAEHELTEMKVGDQPLLEALGITMGEMRRAAKKDYEELFESPQDEGENLLSLEGLGIQTEGAW